MEEIVVSTVVYQGPEEVYDLLADFPRYTRYTEYLKEVRRVEGDGGAGTRYDLRFAWWKLSYTARSEVTGVDPPERIDWRLVKDLDAQGRWRIEPRAELPADAPEWASTACDVRLEAEYDPHSARESALSLPRFVSMDWVVRKAVPLVREELRQIFQRAARDLEGHRRDVTVDVETSSESA